MTGSTEKKYLIVGPSWVGDMVMAQALFKTLRRQHADCSIDVVAPEWSLPIIRRMPEVRRGVGLPTGHGEFAFNVRRRLGAELRQAQYDHAIVLPRSFKSALVPFFSGAQVRTGFRGEMRFGLLNDIRPLDKSVLDQTVKRFVALGLPRNQLPDVIPQPELRIDSENQRSQIENWQLNVSRPVIALMPGASYGPAKCWPLEYFAELASRLSGQNLSVWVLGGAGDQAAGEQIVSGVDGALNLCGKTRLEDTVDLLALSAAAVTNDSGLMHVAAAAGTHTIAMYGSSSPGYTPALTANKTVHYLNLECSPCFKRECPLGHLNCLTKISVDAVMDSVSGALATGNA